MATASKRLRFEVLRRDNHACRYCGRSAPEVELTVDAVVPEALGGSHKDPANLVAACRDCNSGKSATPPDAPLVADVAQDALRWSQAMQAAADEMLADLEARKANREQFRQWWDDWTYGAESDRKLVPKDQGWEQSVDQWVAAGLPMAILKDCIGLAMTRDRVKIDQKFRYMCGIAWSKVNDLQKAAHPQAVPTADDEDELSPEVLAGRSNLAHELLGNLEMDDIDRLLAEAREDWQAETKDEQAIAAAHIAWIEMQHGYRWLAYSIYELLEVLPGSEPREAMRRARTELYDEKGATFSRQEFADCAVETLGRIYQVQDARAYLESLPEDERAEWLAFSAAVYGEERSAEYREFLHPAACAREVKRGALYEGMCQAPGKHIRFCPSRASHSARIDGFDCCQDPGDDDHGHPLCDDHLERMDAGNLTTRSGKPLALISHKPFSADPVPF